jgi:tetratricopeptide (TPR) repeat protein
VTNDFVDAAGALHRAEGLIEVRRYEQAASAASQAVAMDPNRSWGWCVLAQAQLGLGDNGGAADSARRAAAISPDNPTAHQLASVALGKLGRHGEAVRSAREAVRIAPDSWRALTRLAHALVPTALHPVYLTEAREIAGRARDLAPLEPFTHLTVGTVESAANNRDEAIQAYTRVLELDPQNAVAYNELARLHLRQSGGGFAPNHLARAINRFANAVQSAPEESVARHNVDVVVGIFLARACYLIFLAAWASTFVDHSGAAVARAVPVAVLLIPAVFAGIFVARLTPSLRRYLRRALVHPPHRLVATTAESCAVVLILATALTPKSDRPLFAVCAAGFALLARIVLYLGRVRAA